MWSLHAADSIYYTIWRIIALLHDCDEFLCAEVCSGVEITRNFIIWAWLYLFFLLLSFLYCFSLFNSAWLGLSKSAHPPNAIHHGTLSHLIATLRIASAPRISPQCWSSGSQQSCYSCTKNHRIKEVLSRFLAGNPPSPPASHGRDSLCTSLLGTSMSEVPMITEEKPSKIVKYWCLGANWPRRKEEHPQVDRWMCERYSGCKH